METDKKIQTYHRIFNFYREQQSNWSADDDEEDDGIVYDTLKFQLSERGELLFHGEVSNFNIGKFYMGWRRDDQIISDLDLLAEPQGWDIHPMYRDKNNTSSARRVYSRSCCAGGTHIFRYRINIKNLEIFLKESESHKIERMNQSLMDGGKEK